MCSIVPDIDIQKRHLIFQKNVFILCTDWPWHVKRVRYFQQQIMFEDRQEII